MATEKELYYATLRLDWENADAEFKRADATYQDALERKNKIWNQLELAGVDVMIERKRNSSQKVAAE